MAACERLYGGGCCEQSGACAPGQTGEHDQVVDAWRQQHQQHPEQEALDSTGSSGHAAGRCLMDGREYLRVKGPLFWGDRLCERFGDVIRREFWPFEGDAFEGDSKEQ